MRQVTQDGGRLEPIDDRIELLDSVLHGVDLSGVRLTQLRVFSSLLDDCDLSRVVVAGGGHFGGRERPTILRGCDFTHADLRALLPSAVRFERCKFTQTRLDSWRCIDAEFVDCTFVGTMHDIVFYGAPIDDMSRRRLGRDYNEFSGNDFRAAELRGVEFRGGIDLDKQRLPGGPLYVMVRELPKRLARAREAVDRWSQDGEDDERRLAQSMLDLCEFGSEAQETGFFERTFPDFVPAQLRERIWELLGAD